MIPTPAKGTDARAQCSRLSLESHTRLRPPVHAHGLSVASRRAKGSSAVGSACDADKNATQPPSLATLAAPRINSSKEMSHIDSTPATLTATAQAQKPSEPVPVATQQPESFARMLLLVAFMFGAVLWADWQLHDAAERGRAAQEAR